MAVAVPVSTSVWDRVMEMTKSAQNKGSDPLMWAVDLSSTLLSSGVSVPSTMFAELLVSHICWSNNVPIAWKFLEKALSIRIVPPMLVLALLSNRVIPSRRSHPAAFRLYLELLKRHIFPLASEVNGPNYHKHKCVACFQQFKKKEHLVAHMKISHHSVHQPKCGVCQKHCKSLESLREHISGPLAKAHCSSIFSQKGCILCLKVFESPNSLGEHKELCLLTPPACLGTVNIPYKEFEASGDENYFGKRPEAIAIDCQMVGGGSDGSLDLLARVCLIDEEENMVFHTYVKPQISVTDYRYELIGLTEEHLRDATPLREVQEKISQILYNGESIGKARLDGGKAKLLVGHNLDHDLDCLLMNYPEKLLRDTATYRPLMKTNLVSHSLTYLTKTYLGYDIRLGAHDAFQDGVSVMRLYKCMRSQEHQDEKTATLCGNNTKQNPTFENQTSKDLENMSPDELFQISTSNYQCWCLDSRPREPPRDWNYSG